MDLLQFPQEEETLVTRVEGPTEDLRDVETKKLKVSDTLC